MELFAWPWFPLAGGALVGAIAGFAARRANFCTLNAIERWGYAGDLSGLRAWMLAAFVALVLTQLAAAAGWANPAQSFYLAPSFGLTGGIAGGILFGYGMALVGTCGFGALVRAGGGSLKSMIALVVLAISALATQKGVLASTRVAAVDNLAIDLTPSPTQSIGDLLTTMTGTDMRVAAALALALALGWFALGGGEWLRHPARFLAGAAIGACVATGWVLTGLIYRNSFDPTQIEAGSFVVPVGDALLLVLAATGTRPDYGVGLVLGVVAGATVAAILRRDVRWEACDDARELSRHLAGAALMGIGGVMAMGCTIGQGVTAMSAMAVSAPVVLGSILLGARLGLSYLLEGSSFALFQRSAGTPPAQRQGSGRR